MIPGWSELSRSEAVVLAEIVTEPGQRTADLAEEVGFSPRHVRNLVGSLIARGMVRTRTTLRGRAWVWTYTATSRGAQAIAARLGRTG